MSILQFSPNRLKVNSQLLREVMAEFLATFFLTLCGDGVMAVLTFKRTGDVSMIAATLGWSFALMIAICIAGGVSGGQANPAATLALATAGKCPWKKVPPYLFAQYFGGFMAAFVVFFVYHDALNAFDGGVRSSPPHANATAQIFSCFPQSFVSISSCFLDQVIGTCLLLLVVSSVTDYRNLQIPRSAQPQLSGLGLGTVMLGFGYNCMAPLNPARDLGPRIFTFISGWGTDVFSHRGYNWFWVPVVGPHVGGIVGVWLYRLLVEIHWPVSTYVIPSEVTDIQLQKTDSQRRSSVQRRSSLLNRVQSEVN